MRIAVAASIATDHLMTFPGRFAESMVADKLHAVSLSFLVDRLEVRRGGVGANIAFGLGCLGLRPALVGAAGVDFPEYRDWLRAHGVDCDSVRVSEERHTARFICTTDLDQNQIAAFYPGAMIEARTVGLSDVEQRLGGLDLVLVGADDVEAMLGHTDECRERGYRFVADPSQQLARMDGPDIRRLVEGADVLFCNEYESALLQQKTGWTDAQVRERVGMRVTTQGAAGSIVEVRGVEPVVVPAAPERSKADPTGVGDGYRSGFLAGLAWGLPVQRCAELGSLVATQVLETVGTQEYTLERESFLQRLRDAYGDEAAGAVEPHLTSLAV